MIIQCFFRDKLKIFFSKIDGAISQKIIILLKGLFSPRKVAINSLFTDIFNEN